MKTKISKIFGVILVLIIALSSISMNLVKADIQIMEPYKSYCRRDTAYTWFTRISTTDVANGDDVGVWYTLPWSFPYFGEYKTRVWICSNGFLTFDPTPALTDYSNTPEEFKERYMIAPFWDDLRTDVSGGIVSTPGVYVDYVENCIVITWEATRYGEPADSIKFQVVLAPSGIIRVSKNYITGAGGFTPTYGISKGTTIDFLSLSYAPYYATWDFLYDVDDLFYYDRAGAPILDPPTYYCLTSGGYVYNGECHSGPPVSRDYVPDYFEFHYESNSYFGTAFKWYENLYSSAQSWAGRDFCYTFEFNIPRVSGTITNWYAHLPEYEWNPITPETWGVGSVLTWETDVHVFHPENLQPNTLYWAEIWMSMEPGYSITDVIATESELYDDGTYLGIPWSEWTGSVNGLQKDWFKQYLGSFWVNNGVVRFGCSPPKQTLERVTYQGGTCSVTSPANSTSAQISNFPKTYTYGDLTAYISSRIDATKKLIANTNKSQYIPATVTLKTPVSPEDYIDLTTKMGIKVNSYSVKCTEGYGGSLAPSEQTPYDEKFESKLKRGVEIIGITGFQGSIPSNQVITLQNDERILLVDPWEDLNVRQLKQKYINEGYSVDVILGIDLWPRYNALKTS